MSEYQVESEVEEGESKKRCRAASTSTKREGIFTSLDFDIHCIVFCMHCAVAQFRKMVPYGAVERVVRYTIHPTQRRRERGREGRDMELCII